MEFQGPSEEYLLLYDLTASNSLILQQVIPSGLSLLWVTQEGMQLKIDGREYTFQRDEVVCLTEFHRLEIGQISAGRLVRFNRPFYCIIDHDSEVGCRGILFFGASQLPVFSIPVEEKDKFDVLWRTFSLEMQSADALQIDMLQIMLKRLLILCTRLYKGQRMADDGRKSGDIQIIREYNFLVEQHFKTKHTVAEYAELLYKSPKTLSNLFARHGNGKTPVQLIQERKMLEARRLLRYSDMPVKEIAYDLGYEDLQTFSRFFKAQEGLSPSEYRGKV